MNYRSLLQMASWQPLWLQHPPAWVGHMPFAYWLMKETFPFLMVELGTQSGNSYFSFCQSVAENNLKAVCCAVDTWKGDVHSEPYGEEIFDAVLRNNHKYKFSTLIRTTFDNALGHFRDGSIDILHIDGLHTYEAVKHDFEMWFPKVSEAGIVLLHDTQVKHVDFGVWKVWEELKHQYPCMEFVHSNGLGVLSRHGQQWFDDTDFRLYFTSLGIHLMEHYDLRKLRG